MPRDSAAADRPASYLVGTAAAFPLFFRDRAKPINQLPFSPSAKFPKSGSSCESRVNDVPADAAGKTVKDLHVEIDVQRRPRVAMERAQRFPLSPTSATQFDAVVLEHSVEACRPLDHLEINVMSGRQL